MTSTTGLSFFRSSSGEPHSRKRTQTFQMLDALCIGFLDFVIRAALDVEPHNANVVGMTSRGVTARSSGDLWAFALQSLSEYTPMQIGKNIKHVRTF